VSSLSNRNVCLGAQAYLPASSGSGYSLYRATPGRQDACAPSFSDCRRSLLSRLPRALALIAQTQLSQSLPGINTVVVPVAEQKLHTVAAYVFGA
jgi:hypothetical protein